MPRETERHSLIYTVVTPRFEVFYALQALETGAGDHLDKWRAEMDRRLPARLRAGLASVAPTALMWPLLADALRESPPGVTFQEMVDALRRMDERTFQTFVLGGVFKSPRVVESLVSRTMSLARAARDEAGSGNRLIMLLGMQPFEKSSPGALAFERMVSDASAYRDEVVNVLESFWVSGFSDTWHLLEPVMRAHANEMRTQATRRLFPEFARENKLPITIENDAIVSARGQVRAPLKSAVGIYLVPSSFNVTRLWAAYADARGRTRYYLPVLDTASTPFASAAIEPAAVFRALGDTTRYAIASSIAHAPMTSVELARAFGVSKPTISHHVQVLRSAGLLDEAPTPDGVKLTINRRALEKLSSAVTREMFSDDDVAPVVKRSRRPRSSR